MAKKPTGKKAAAKKTVTKKTAKKATAKATAKKSVAKKPVAKKKATAKKVVAKKTGAKKPVPRKAAAKKTAAGSASGKKPAASMRITATPADGSDKQHLTDIVQGYTGSTQAAAKQAVDAVLETMALSLKKNEKVQLLGFGTFEVAKRKARKGRNPATGESIRIKASKTVRFRPGTKLKAAV